jgi:hypothetical protein
VTVHCFENREVKDPRTVNLTSHQVVEGFSLMSISSQSQYWRSYSQQSLVWIGHCMCLPNDCCCDSNPYIQKENFTPRKINIHFCNLFALKKKKKSFYHKNAQEIRIKI